MIKDIELGGTLGVAGHHVTTKKLGNYRNFMHSKPV